MSRSVPEAEHLCIQSQIHKTIYLMFFLLLLVAAGAQSTSMQPDVKRTFLEICANDNYPVEEHFTTTTDGYILRLFRIGAKGQSISSGPPVYLQHGLIDSSDTFVVNDEALAPGFILANAGFDVWLGNSRGNKYSRNHTTLNPNTDPEFWSFSWQEMSDFDIPSSVDYVLAQTGKQKLAYVGHSQGTTILMARLSVDSVLAEQITVAALLAPVAAVSNQTSTLLTLLSKVNLPFVLNILHINEVFEAPDSYFISYLCYFDSAVCSSMLYLLADANTTVDNIERMDVVMSHYPSGTSTQDLIHWIQMIREPTATLQKFNFGSPQANIQAYGVPVPPTIDLTKVQGKLALFAGLYDRLADPKDVEWLMTQLPTQSVIWFKGDYPCGHGTFLWGKNMTYFNDVLNVLKESFQGEEIAVSS